MPQTVQVAREGPGGEVFLRTDAVSFIRADDEGRVYVSQAHDRIRFNEVGEVFVTIPGYVNLYGNPNAESTVERRGR